MSDSAARWWTVIVDDPDAVRAHLVGIGASDAETARRRACDVADGRDQDLLAAAMAGIEQAIAKFPIGVELAGGADFANKPIYAVAFPHVNVMTVVLDVYSPDWPRQNGDPIDYAEALKVSELPGSWPDRGS